MKHLTKAEEDIMQILWKLEEANVAQIIEELPKPKPAYNTVSTIVRILETKGFVSYNSYGKSHQYYPITEKEDYSNQYMKNFISNYFEGSFERMVSFFAKENNISLNELDEILKTSKKNNNHE